MINRDAKKVVGLESEIQSLSCPALYELSLLQHVHYFQTHHFDKKKSVINNGKNSSNRFEKNGINNADLKNHNDTKKKNIFCENISIPLGVCSIQNNINLPSVSNQNFQFTFLDNGNFNSKINLSLCNNHKNNINSNNNIKINNVYDVEMNDNIEILSTIGKELNIDLGNNNESYDTNARNLTKNNTSNNSNILNDINKNNKINPNMPPQRFLVFPSVHLSLSSVLPLILIHNNKDLKINDNMKNNERSVKKQNDKYNDFEEVQNISNNIDIPPISALFSRDLCSDLISAVNHCIKWYVYFIIKNSFFYFILFIFSVLLFAYFHFIHFFTTYR